MGFRETVERAGADVEITIVDVRGDNVRTDVGAGIAARGRRH